MKAEEQMKNLTRAAATVIAAVGIAAFAAPTASAAPVAGAEKAAHHYASSHQGTSYNYYLVFGDALFADESGPGDQSSNLTERSRGTRTEAQNEAIKTGDIKTHVKGKGHTLPIEVEGSEQDQGEGA